MSDYLPGFLPHWLQAVIVFSLIVAVGLLLQAGVVHLVGRLSKDWHPSMRLAFTRTRTLGRFAILLMAIALALPLVPLSQDAGQGARRVFGALLILLLGWMASVAAHIFMDRYEARMNLTAPDNLMARKAITQLRIFRGALNVLIGLLTAAFALMSFDSVRQFGISLFASAGIAGLVAGLAVRPLFENLIAGLQLALTQPLRLDDSVVINNEWGNVEEITSTYIVVRLWDLRRQVVPLSYLFQNPFQNWTRSSASIIGTVMLYLDYSLPLEPLRQKARDLAKASPLWDGQTLVVQVSDAREQTMEVRIIASAANASKAWDLRCELRGKLIAFVREEYSHALPRQRREDIVLYAGENHPRQH